MDAKDIFEVFVTPMRKRFALPQGVADHGFLAELAESLEGYSAHQLEAASRWFRDNRTRQTFPTIAECRQVCERFAPAAAQAAPTARTWKPAEEERSEAIAKVQRRHRAVQLCRGSELAHQASAESWLVGLLEFCEDNGRLPDDREWRSVRAGTHAVDANLHRDPKPFGYPGLCRLRAEMHARAAREVFAGGGRDQSERSTGWHWYEPHRSEPFQGTPQDKLQMLRGEPVPKLSDAARASLGLGAFDRDPVPEAAE